MAVALLFDPDVPSVQQLFDYDCAVATTTWCLHSIGNDVSLDTMADIMVPDLVTERDGLLFATGETLAALFRDRFDLQADNQAFISFDEVVERAGRQPMAIGSRDWFGGIGHSVGVRRVNDDGELELANPAENSAGFGQRVLDRDGFDARGAFAAVFIQVDEAGALPARFRVVNTDGVGISLRNGPTVDDATNGTVAEGGIVRAVQPEGFAWRALQDESGTTGWLPDADLTEEGDAFRVISNDNPGLREGPGTDMPMVKELAGGTVLRPTDPSNEAFCLVRGPDGTVGWARAQFLERL